MYTIYPFIHPCLPHSKNPINASYCYQCDKKKKKIKGEGRHRLQDLCEGRISKIDECAGQDRDHILSPASGSPFILKGNTGDICSRNSIFRWKGTAPVFQTV